jgi:hypothetical protein
MKWMALAFLGALTGCSNAAPPPRAATASSVASPKASFANYETFAFGPANAPAEGYEITPRALEVQTHLTRIVARALERRGYRELPAGADLLVKIAAGSGELPNPSAEHGTASPSGFIAVDIYEAASGNEVWRGTAQAAIDPNQIDDALLERGVDRMLANLPARAAGSVASTH